MNQLPINYYLTLLNAVNSYSGKEDQANEIRNLICYISDSPQIEKTNELKELLFEASQLLRVFGYNKLNKIDQNEINQNNDFAKIRTKLIYDNYRTASDSNAYLDKRQKEIIATFQEHRKIFVSAPTSFGKTHILKEIIYLNKDKHNNIVLIFPTVALLVENMDSINEFNEKHQLNYNVLNSFQEIDEESPRNIFILTPERAITIFEEEPKLKIDFFFFDEVYKIDEDFNTSDDYDDDSVAPNDIQRKKEEYLPYSRAVAFRLVLYFLSKFTPEFYLAGPYINLDNLKNGMNRFIEKFNVKKILITSEATLKTYIKAWNKDVEAENKIAGLSKIDFGESYKKNTAKKDKLKTICDYLHKNEYGQTLVYCDTPARALQWAMEISDTEKPKSSELQELIQHLESRYSVPIKRKSNQQSSKEWSLTQILSAGLGTHHGKLPKYVQKEILKLFNDGDLEILFCTSTLIEGVNTVAKNIIVASSTIRISQPLNQFDIKNIIGRAGRYYHHFLGRIFFIEEDQFEILNGPDQKLNFPLFDNVELAAEDFDNMLIDDFDDTLKSVKALRDMNFDYELLPNRIFVKNRLFDRHQQELLLKSISKNFDKYTNYFRLKDNSKQMLEYDKFAFVNLFLDSLSEAKIINEKQILGHASIIRSYSYGGVKNIIDYEMNYNGNNPSTDTGYSNAFNKLKTVIEYQMPRYFTLLQALYNYICETKNLSEEKQVDLSRLIRFFEVGAESAVGLFLIEHGMPSGVVRDIEKSIWNIKNMPLEEGKITLANNKAKILHLFDAYETKIFNRLI